MKKNKTISQNKSGITKLNETKRKVTVFVRNLTWVVIGGICAVISLCFTICSNMRESEKASTKVGLKIGGFEFDDFSTVLVYYICPINEIGANYINGILPFTISNNTNF